jgi:hypothetical protein
MEPKSKHEIYLCFIYTFYTQPEGLCVIFYLWCHVSAQSFRFWLGVVVYTYNPSTREGEAEGH